MYSLIERFPVLAGCMDDIEKAIGMIIKCYEDGGKLILAGNGGSSADCDHIVGELMKGFLLSRRLSSEKISEMKKNCPALDDNTLTALQGALPAISISSQTALTSAYSNDENPEMVFAQGVMGLMKEKDILIAISTSGNSKNVLAAAAVAKGLGGSVIGLTGIKGGKLNAICDITIKAPESETFKVQELHLPIYHYICARIEDHFFA